MLSARSQGVRRSQGGRSALVDAEPLGSVLVGPWQYQCSRLGQYPVYHPPSTPAPTPVHPTAWYTPAARTVTSEHVPGTAVLASTKEILGVDNALGVPRHAMACVWHCQPPYGHGSTAAPWRLVLTILRYISVFLSISQYFPRSLYS